MSPNNRVCSLTGYLLGRAQPCSNAILACIQMLWSSAIDLPGRDAEWASYTHTPKVAVSPLSLPRLPHLFGWIAPSWQPVWDSLCVASTLWVDGPPLRLMDFAFHYLLAIMRCVSALHAYGNTWFRKIETSCTVKIQIYTNIYSTIQGLFRTLD